jgi:MarR family transcriptional regulator, organic hydroperoxide resistance regulator
MMTRKNATMALGDQLCFSFYSTSHAFSRAYRQFLDPLGLTYPQYVVLLVLWEQDGLAVKEIGEKLFLDSGTLTPLLKRLESAGLIRRTRDPGDERQVKILLTDQGRALKAKAEEVPGNVGCVLGLSYEEARELSGLISKLRGKLHASVPPLPKP